jgi:hypothetical protein
VIGLVEAFEQFDRDPETRPGDATGGSGLSPPPEPDAPVDRPPQASEPGTTGMIDTAIDALGSEASRAPRLQRVKIDRGLPHAPSVPETPRRAAPLAPQPGRERPAQGPLSITVPAALFAGYLARSEHDRPVPARRRNRQGVLTPPPRSGFRSSRAGSCPPY